MTSAITLDGSSLILRFPCGDFTDTLVSGLKASKQYSHAGDVRVRAWSSSEIARWRTADERWQKYGRATASLIKRSGRPVDGGGLVQRLARRLGVPLNEPPKQRTVVQNVYIDGSGWLA